MRRLAGGWRRQFETLPEYQEPMRAEYGIIREVRETLTASQPEIFAALALAIERAINLLETDSD